jgi:hypothetical protein
MEIINTNNTKKQMQSLVAQFKVGMEREKNWEGGCLLCEISSLE